MSDVPCARGRRTDATRHRGGEAADGGRHVVENIAVRLEAHATPQVVPLVRNAVESQASGELAAVGARDVQLEVAASQPTRRHQAAADAATVVAEAALHSIESDRRTVARDPSTPFEGSRGQGRRCDAGEERQIRTRAVEGQIQIGQARGLADDALYLDPRSSDPQIGALDRQAFRAPEKMPCDFELASWEVQSSERRELRQVPALGANRQVRSDPTRRRAESPADVERDRSNVDCRVVDEEAAIFPANSSAEIERLRRKTGEVDPRADRRGVRARGFDVQIELLEGGESAHPPFRRRGHPGHRALEVDVDADAVLHRGEAAVEPERPAPG